MFAKNIHCSLRVYVLLLSVSASLSSYGAEYWVTKLGSDQNNCTNDSSDACLTIQKGVSKLSAGDTLNVKAGTYSDDGGASAYKPSGSFCGWLDSEPPSSNVCMDHNGTAGNPIVVQAAPGHEGLVTIDAQGNKIGIHLQNSDYIHIRGFNIINSRTIGLASWGQPENNVADESRLSIGVVVENNSIKNTTGQYGKNTSAIGMWGTKNWIVRNNLIDGVSAEGGTLASGMQSYGTINALVENNHIKNADFGIFWKDHFIVNTSNRDSIFESEIRFNEIESNDRGINIGIKGGNTVEAGDNYIHHNIIYGHGNAAAGIHIAMSGAHSISGEMRIEHNLVDGENNSSTGISADSSDGISMSGNIIVRTDLDLEFISYSSGKIPELYSSNHNVFKSAFSMIADRYAGSSTNFSSLGSWQSSVDADLITLKFSGPDAQSVTSSHTSLFTDITNKDYTLAAGSAAIGLMPDGSDAGPYQNGNEIVGLLPSWPSYDDLVSSISPPSPPTNFLVQLTP